MSHADSGLAYLTFSNNFTWSGYGISLESFGPLTIAGTWTNDNRGNIGGGYSETFPDGTVFGWSISAKLPGGDKFFGRSVSLFNRHLLRLKLRGTSTNSVPDVSGSWDGEVKTRGDRFFENYTLTASKNKTGWFDLDGQGVDSSGTFTLSGALIVGAKHRANGYTISDYGSSMTVTSSFKGRFNSPLTKIVFIGRDNDHHRIVIRATQQ